MESIRNKTLRILRSAEPFLKLDMVYLARGGFWTTLRFVVGVLSSLVTVVAFGNLLPREVYGTYNYLLALGASLSFLTLSGTGTAVMRSVSRGYENIIPHALRLYLKYNMLSVSLVMLVAIYYGYKGNLVFAGALALLSVAYPISEAYHLYVQILTGRKRFDLLTKIASITSLVGAIATFSVLLLTDNVLALIATYTLISLIPNFITYKITTRKIDRSAPSREQINEFERTSFHVTGSGIIGVIASYIDKIILFQIAGPASLAVYGFAIAGPERLKSLVKNWTSIALPRLAQSSLVQVHVVVYKRIALSTLIGGSLSLIYILTSPILFKIFLPRYLDSIIYSQVISLGLIFVPTSVYIGSVFSGQNMLRAIYALNFGSQVLRIVLFITFAWLWHIWGLVFAYLLSSIANAIYGIIILEIETKRLINKNETQ